MRKPHLFSSEEQWQHWGVNLPTLCGRTVAEAHWIAVLDSTAPIWIEARGVCRKCHQSQGNGSQRRRYLYVIAEGQEALDEAV